MNINSSWNKILGYFAIVSPLAMIIGYGILMARSGQGPDTGWFLSHVFLLIGIGLLIPTTIGIKVILNQAASRVSDIGVTLSFFGGLALIGQFSIDLAVGQLSATQSEMIELFNLISNSPIIAIAFQSVGPIMFYIGLLILITLLLNKKIINWQPGVIAILGVIGVGTGAITGIALITLLGFAGIFIGFISVGLKFFMVAELDC